MKLDDNTSVYKERDFKLLLPNILGNLNDLKNSRSFIDNISLREFFGLFVVTNFRKHIEPTKDWFFCTDKKISDDGAISYFGINQSDIDYPYEKLEQVYLPHFFKRKDNEHYEDLLTRFLENKKLNKSISYKTNKSLFILNDIDTKQGFNWKKVLQLIFPKGGVSYSHFYYLGYMGQNDDFLSYIFLSFADKPYRSYLNGQFRILLYKNGDCQVKKVQDINVNDIWNINT